MSQWKALVSKEIKEAVRDKRALMAAMVMAFLAPVLIFALSKMAVKEVAEKPDVFVHVEGAQFAPDLLDVLNKENVFPISEADDKELEEWEQRKIELVIPEDYAELMQESRVIELILRADMGEKSVSSPLRRIRKAINGYASTIGAKRLLMRGISTSVVQPMQIQEQDTATPNSNAMFISNMLIFYLLFGAFITGLSVAVDTSAGERERNVLELLLSQPVTTSQVVGAKLVSASLISIIGVVLTLVLTMFALGFVDLSAIGVSFQLNMASVIVLISLLLPVCLLASIAQLFLAFQAKSFKEAQSTVSMVILLPAFVPFALMMMDTKPAWLDALPISGQYLIMEEIMKGSGFSIASVALVSVVTLAATAVLFALLAKKLESEKTVLALS